MTIPEAGGEGGGWLGKMEGNCTPTPLPACPHHSPLQTRQPCPSFISTRAASRHGPLRRAGPHSHLLTVSNNFTLHPSLSAIPSLAHPSYARCILFIGFSYSTKGHHLLYVLIDIIRRKKFPPLPTHPFYVTLEEF